MGSKLLCKKPSAWGAWASQLAAVGLHSPVSVSLGGVQFVLWPKFGLVFGLVLGRF